jgi:hypothetical protein
LKAKKIKAYYFAQENKRLRHGDNRLVKKGVTHTHQGLPILCKQGLHASIRLRDALFYAPGPVICEVELSGEVIKGDDKCVATKRKYLSVRNVSRELRIFAVDCAKRELKRENRAGRIVDDASWNVVDAAYLHADGLIDDEALTNAACAAAWVVALSATKTAGTTAVDALRAAMRVATCGVNNVYQFAEFAAREAANNTAINNPDEERECEWQEKRLTELLFPKGK